MPNSPDDATPVIAQYLAIKDQHPDCLLFFRMGDFYEMFFEDATAAAAALDIVLTKRGRHAGDDIPMCGVPAHACDAYLARLIRQGFRVALCEQVEDPAAARRRGAKAVVQRAVTRIVTPGTLTEDDLLDARAHNWLAAVAQTSAGLGLAWADLSTGAFHVQDVGAAALAAGLARLRPREVLCPERLAASEALTPWRDQLTTQPDSRFDPMNAEARLKDFYGVASLQAFGRFSTAMTAAAGAILDYAALTQVGWTPRLAPPTPSSDGATMEIDPTTQRSLELTQTLAGTQAGSLLDAVDRTITASGARLLAARLGAPLTDPAAIAARLDAVGFFHDDAAGRGEVRALLCGAPDLERALGRLALGRGGPRDLTALRDGLGIAAQIATTLAPHQTPPALTTARQALEGHEALTATLRAALEETPPPLLRDGGFIRPGFDAPLDKTRATARDGRQLIAALQTQYQEQSGIDSLKIRFNNVLGYFIEVTARHAAALTAPRFIHRQTVSNAVRYATTELADLARDIAEAGERALALEKQLFADLCAQALARASEIAAAAAALAAVDWAAALADLAADEGWIRPEVDRSRAFRIEGGRHPVVEAALRRRNDAAFAANDCDLGPSQRLWLLTGPNMAGKSTFLRQNALIATLAQSGGYVPAKRCRIGVIDRLFSRVGAADDLARGQSTFMVEMVETAAILNRASDRSLVILDEIGRGTATFDGLAIAWACVERLHDVIGARTLFATHYHELTALAGRLAALRPYAMRVREWKGKIIFLHEAVPGAADRSYGLHVARLAGLPAAVIARAETVLAMLEQTHGGGAAAVRDLPLFQNAVAPPAPAAPNPGPPAAALTALAALDPDALTPRQALAALYELKQLTATAQEGG